MQHDSLREAVRECGVKQCFIARELGVSDGVVSRILSGHREVLPKERKVFARILRKKQKDLFE